MNENNDVSENKREKIDDDIFWKNFLRKHWFATIIISIGIILMVFLAIFVIIWHVESSEIGGQGTWTLNEWSIGTMISFLLLLLLWEILFVFIPIAVYFGIVISLMWFQVLTEEEKGEFRKEKKTSDSHKRGKSGGGGFSFIVFLAFLIIVFIEGNWNVTFANLAYSYFVYTWLTALLWVLLIFGIPLAILLLIWSIKTSSK